MKKILAIALCSLPFALAPTVYAQTTDSAVTASAESGWSVKDGIMGKAVYNENNDKVGDVTDVLVSNDGKIISFIVGAGGFLGMGEHNVAIPFDKLRKNDDKLFLAGYTKDQLKELPAYKAPKSTSSIMPGTTSTPAASGTLGTVPGTVPGTTPSTPPSTPATK